MLACRYCFISSNICSQVRLGRFDQQMLEIVYCCCFELGFGLELEFEFEFELARLSSYHYSSQLFFRVFVIRLSKFVLQYYSFFFYYSQLIYTSNQLYFLYVRLQFNFKSYLGNFVNYSSLISLYYIYIYMRLIIEYSKLDSMLVFQAFYLNKYILLVQDFLISSSQSGLKFKTPLLRLDYFQITQLSFYGIEILFMKTRGSVGTRINYWIFTFIYYRFIRCFGFFANMQYTICFSFYKFFAYYQFLQIILDSIASFILFQLISFNIFQSIFFLVIYQIFILQFQTFLQQGCSSKINSQNITPRENISEREEGSQFGEYFYGAVQQGLPKILGFYLLSLIFNDNEKSPILRIFMSIKIFEGFKFW